MEINPKMPKHPRLLAPILAGKADVVYGSRFAGGESKRVLFFWRKSEVGQTIVSYYRLKQCINKWRYRAPLGKEDHHA